VASPRPLVTLARWLFALVTPGAALAVSLLLRPLIDQVPSPPFVAAVLAVAWLSGFEPALLAIVVSAVALDYYFVPPIHAFGLAPREVVWMALFVTTSLAVAWLVANRVHSRQHVMRSAEQLRFITDAAPVMIYYVDAEGRYRFANRPYAERYGFTPETIVGRHVAEVVGAARYETLRERLAAALAGRRTTFEATGPGPDGSGRHLLVTYVPDVADDRTRGMVAVISDITDRKRVEDERARVLALEQTRRREAEAIAELGRVLTQGLDVDSVAQRLVELARGLLRATATTAYRIDPDSGDFVCLAISGDMGPFRPGGIVPRDSGVVGAAVRQGRTVWSADILNDPTIAFADDTRRWILQAGYRAVLAVPLRVKTRVVGGFALGDALGRVFSPEDVRLAEAFADHAAVALENARLYTEAEARAARARLLADVSRALAGSLDYEATLDTVAQLVVPQHADWFVVHLARRDGSARRLGVAHADPAHAGLAAQTRALPPAADWLAHAGALIDTLRAGRSIFLPRATPTELDAFAGGLQDRRIFEALHPHSLLTVPLVARGRTLGSMTWLRIATPTPFGADDLALAEDLAARIALAIDNARLYREAERMRIDAEDANRAKDEFLAVLSHELRTPLTAMLGWLRLLRAGQLNADKTAQALEVVERNTRAQAQLINDLLDVSRIVAGKLQLDLYPVDLAPIMEEAVELSRADADAKGVKVELTVDEGTGPVIGDPLRLGQIVANLVTNAVKFTPTAGRVHVALARGTSGAVVTVSDTGIGIEATLLPRIFDRFRQADSTLTRRHGGLGLGLAIVRHLAELHGGSVRAASPGPGQGATFTVELPLAASTGRRGRGEAVGAHGTAEGVLLGLRLLIVEDHRDTADLMRTVLESHGALVRVVDSVGGALDVLEGADLDILLSDIAMPDGTGYELVRGLRALERARGRRPIAAVAVTAFAGAEDRERAGASGFQHFATKPIEPVELVETVARAAGRSSTGRRGRTP